MRKQALRPLLVLIPLLVPMSVFAADARHIGRKIEDFALNDFRGKGHSLADFEESKLIVVAFLGTECPLVKLYGPKLEQMSQEYGPRGVAFVGICSNQQDAITEIAAFARVHEIHFPMLKDVGNVVADQFGAERTPEVYVLDEDRVVRYRGRVDDQYRFSTGVGYARPGVARQDLKAALDDLLAGKEVNEPTTEIKGCLIGRVKQPQEDSEVTYSNQVARVFQQHCVSCHRPGEIAPFALQSYEDAAGWGEMIREVVEEQRMPPWHADPKHGKFRNDSSLSNDEKELIYQWVDNGCPEGDPANLPEPRQFTVGWQIDEPDFAVQMSDKPNPVAADGVIEYQYFVIDPGFTEDKWVRQAEARPGNRAVVHHIIVFVQPPRAGQNSLNVDGFGGFLVAYAPGAKPLDLADGMAKKIPAGSKFIFQMHYTPIGTEQADISSVAMVFADPESVKVEVETGAAVSPFLQIPPHDPDHVVTARRTFRRETLLIAMMPHTHLRGKAFRYVAHYPDGTDEILLDIPHYDFNWQNTYELAEPKLMPKGTRLECIAHYDNSADNLANPDPTRTVGWGDQTWDEMMIGFYEAATIGPRRRAKKK